MMMVNPIDFIFINLILVIVCLGSLMSIVEPKLPTIIKQTFRYGKHCHKGGSNALVDACELPKSSFRHFYVFAFVWSGLALYFAFRCYVTLRLAPDFVLEFLDILFARMPREVQTNASDALVAMFLLFLQCSRRFYETNFIQIFSKTSKINISHYIVGYLHYFGATLAIISNSEGFVRDSRINTLDVTEIPLYKIPFISLFLYAWYCQYQSNLILINLRKDGSGKVITEKHLMPQGGYFEYVSSPHMFFEIVMYLSMMPIIPNSTTWRLVTVWVFSNQISNAYLTHQWYKENFKNYPQTRKAIFPFLL